LRSRVGQGKKNHRTPKQLLKVSLAKAGLLDPVKGLRERLTGRATRRAHSTKRS
jgi:hypothetical protein